MDSPADVLEPLLAPFLEAAPAAERAAALLRAATTIGGAEAAAIWSWERTAGWRRLAARGPEVLLPPGRQVWAVAAGELGGGLPGGRVVLAPAPDWAIALGGFDPTKEGAEDNLDLLEAFLVAVVAIEEGTPDLRELEPRQPAAPLPSRGTHGPAAPRHAAELRELLSTIRGLEDRLADPALAPATRGRLRLRLDGACERAGDLLMGDGAS